MSTTGVREVKPFYYILQDYGVFGDGNNKSHKSPQYNDYFEYLKKE